MEYIEVSQVKRSETMQVWLNPEQKVKEGGLVRMFNTKDHYKVESFLGERNGFRLASIFLHRPIDKDW